MKLYYYAINIIIFHAFSFCVSTHLSKRTWSTKACYQAGFARVFFHFICPLRCKLKIHYCPIGSLKAKSHQFSLSNKGVNQDDFSCQTNQDDAPLKDVIPFNRFVNWTNQGEEYCSNYCNGSR